MTVSSSTEVDTTPVLNDEEMIRFLEEKRNKVTRRGGKKGMQIRQKTKKRRNNKKNEREKQIVKS